MSDLYEDFPLLPPILKDVHTDILLRAQAEVDGLISSLSIDNSEDSLALLKYLKRQVVNVSAELTRRDNEARLALMNLIDEDDENFEYFDDNLLFDEGFDIDAAIPTFNPHEVASLLSSMYPGYVLVTNEGSEDLTAESMSMETVMNISEKADSEATLSRRRSRLDEALDAAFVVSDAERLAHAVMSIDLNKLPGGKVRKKKPSQVVEHKNRNSSISSIPRRCPVPRFSVVNQKSATSSVVGGTSAEELREQRRNSRAIRHRGKFGQDDHNLLSSSHELCPQSGINSDDKTSSNTSTSDNHVSDVLSTNLELSKGLSSPVSPLELPVGPNSSTLVDHNVDIQEDSVITNGQNVLFVERNEEITSENQMSVSPPKLDNFTSNSTFERDEYDIILPESSRLSSIFPIDDDDFFSESSGFQIPTAIVRSASIVEVSDDDSNVLLPTSDEQIPSQQQEQSLSINAPTPMSSPFSLPFSDNISERVECLEPSDRTVIENLAQAQKVSSHEINSNHILLSEMVCDRYEQIVGSHVDKQYVVNSSNTEVSHPEDDEVASLAPSTPNIRELSTDVKIVKPSVVSPSNCQSGTDSKQLVSIGGQSSRALKSEEYKSFYAHLFPDFACIFASVATTNSFVSNQATSALTLSAGSSVSPSVSSEELAAELLCVCEETLNLIEVHGKDSSLPERFPLPGVTSEIEDNIILLKQKCITSTPLLSEGIFDVEGAEDEGIPLVYGGYRRDAVRHLKACAPERWGSLDFPLEGPVCGVSSVLFPADGDDVRDPVTTFSQKRICVPPERAEVVDLLFRSLVPDRKEQADVHSGGDVPEAEEKLKFGISPPWMGSSPLASMTWTWSRLPPGRLQLSVSSVNHFRRSFHLTQKDRLKRIIGRVQGLSARAARDFALLPPTFVLPHQYLQFCNAFARGSPASGSDTLGKGAPRFWILKPLGQSRGRGIRVISSIDEVKFADASIIQQYIHDPYLIDGHKFDLRVYVLVTSFVPLEAFVYREGFARFSARPYSLDLGKRADPLVHLTNAAISRTARPEESAGPSSVVSQEGNPSSFIAPVLNSGEDGAGTKTSISYVFQRIAAQEGTEPEALWQAVEAVITKSLICAAPAVGPQSGAFELFGYDVLLDATLRPWLLEVNGSPSLESDSAFDLRLKTELIKDVVGIVNPPPIDVLALRNVLERRLAAAKRTARGGPRVPHAAAGISAGASGKIPLHERKILDKDLHDIFGGWTPRMCGQLPDPRKAGKFNRICPGSETFNKFFHFK